MENKGGESVKTKYPVSKILLLFFLCSLLGFGLPGQTFAKEGQMIESFGVSAGKKGFCPGKGKSLPIKAYVNTSGRTVDIRLRIYNAKGKYVFEKKYKNSMGGAIDYKWNGKPGKKNEAKASAKKYVKKGSYTAELAVLSKEGKIILSQKKCRFKVPAKASSGPVLKLTGDEKVDYMAEQIIKDAKIKESQSESEKVRRIYHWMTVNQKHEHYYEGGSYKKYYRLSSAAVKKKIKSYRKTTDQLREEGKLVYTNDYNLIRRSWNMEHRVGVCTDNAAIFKILCNHVGIEAGICSGYYLNRNGTKPPHSWNYAVVDKVTYYYDVDVEIQNYGKGQGDYYWYQKTKAEAKKTHQFVTID